MKSTLGLRTGDRFNAEWVPQGTTLEESSDLWLLADPSTIMTRGDTTDVMGLDGETLRAFRCWKGSKVNWDLVFRTCETGPMEFEVVEHNVDTRRLILRRSR